MQKPTPTTSEAPLPQSAPPNALEERVRQRAFEIYLERGMEDGHAEDDWYQAERNVNSGGLSLKTAA